MYDMNTFFLRTAIPSISDRSIMASAQSQRHSFGRGGGPAQLARHVHPDDGRAPLKELGGRGPPGRRRQAPAALQRNDRYAARILVGPFEVKSEHAS